MPLFPSKRATCHAALYENSIPKHMGMLFWEKSPRKTTREKVFWEKVFEKQCTKVWFLSQTTLTDPLNGRLILKTSLTDPPNGHQILKAALADPPNGHIFRKTPLQAARKQVFHEKRRKPFRLFGSASSPHGMQQKAGCRETRSTAACLYIDDPSAFNPTISHSRSPADGADWCSWDTCAHSS